MSASDVVKGIAVTAELTGTQLSGEAMAAMASGLMADYPEQAIINALMRCRKEVKYKLTYADIEERISQDDGRPAANEAWGVAIQSFNEDLTVITNDEIQQAMCAATPVYDAGDETGARMAFKEAYERIVRQARQAGIRSPKWYPSLGHDKALRDDAIRQGAERGLLTHSQAVAYLPAPMSADDAVRGNAIAGLLTGRVESLPNDPEFKARLAKVAAILGAQKEAA